MSNVRKRCLADTCADHLKHVGGKLWMYQRYDLLDDVWEQSMEKDASNDSMGVLM
jgi:hypothetical protein